MERDNELAMYAHEMRGALTIVAGYTEMLRRDLNAEDRQRALDGIERAVTRADLLVGALMDGHYSVTECDISGSLDLPSMVREVAEEHAAASGRTIRLELPDTLHICGDGAALARVLDNLISNGLKYSLDRSEVEVTVRRAPGVVVLEVADRGPGIPAEQRDTIFEPYVRLSHDGGVPGSGLGLSVVKRIVDAHSGRIEVADREGGGTVVRVELPFDPAMRL